MLVLEGIPEQLGKAISEALKIPTVGIGAGRYCDGQVLVYHDMLGWSDVLPRFVKKYSEVHSNMISALNTFAQEVRNGSFPTREQVYYPID